MSGVADKLLEGLANAGMMTYEVWWALVLGFAISAMVQAWVPKQGIERSLGGSGLGPIARATGWGAASSSCSYAAIAIARSLFAKGASTGAAMAFQFASTNLVWELGLILWLLLGWQFTLAEFVGGLLLIALMWAGARLFISPRVEQAARRHAAQAPAGSDHCQHHEHDHGHEHDHEHDHGHDQDGAASRLPWRRRLASRQAWSEVAGYFRTDWLMLWKEITIGFLLAGYIALLGEDFFNDLFITESDAGALRTLENVLVGPLIAILSFVCSIGNIPLAAVLWSGGISFAGVMAFIYADLVVLPIVAAYRKYYGWAFAWRIVAIMLATMALAALAIDGLFAAAGLIPEQRPDIDDVFSPIELNYKAVLNALALATFAALTYLSLSASSASAPGSPCHREGEHCSH